MFYKQSSLTLSFLLKIFEWIYKKSILYLFELNQSFSIILDYFSNFLTFKDVLFKLFQS